MPCSPILQCQCVHCHQQITAAEKRRNGYACDRCVARLARERYEWARGADGKRHAKFNKCKTVH